MQAIWSSSSKRFPLNGLYEFNYDYIGTRTTGNEGRRQLKRPRDSMAA
jgi:hypothetical protein